MLKKISDDFFLLCAVVGACVVMLAIYAGVIGLVKLAFGVLVAKIVGYFISAVFAALLAVSFGRDAKRAYLARQARKLADQPLSE